MPPALRSRNRRSDPYARQKMRKPKKSRGSFFFRGSTRKKAKSKGVVATAKSEKDVTSPSRRGIRKSARQAGRVERKAQRAKTKNLRAGFHAARATSLLLAPTGLGITGLLGSTMGLQRTRRKSRRAVRKVRRTYRRTARRG